MVAGVAGRPVTHSLSPVLHNAWLAAAGSDGVYVAIQVADEAAFASLIGGLRGGGTVRGLNVTSPFKERALTCADIAEGAARAAGAANLLLFQPDGSVLARNTDGLGLLHALKGQAAFEPAGRSVGILGAGGAAKGAMAALLDAGAREVRIVNRTLERAEALASQPGVTAWPWAESERALEGLDLLINATTLGLAGAEPLDISLEVLPGTAVVMDMIYRPLRTPLLRQAEARGLRTADGLAMLIGQAIPTFEALFGAAPPAAVDIRAVALEAIR
jgi:shikimate dehydrogenase